MGDEKQKQSRKARGNSDTPLSSAVGLLAVAAVAGLGFWWWRRRHQADTQKPSNSRSAFKFPAAQQTTRSLPRGTGVSNKKNKARRKEEKARRAEKRERALDGPQEAGKNDDQPQSTTVINYSYFDSTRKDTLLPAAKRRPTLSAAEAVSMQQEGAAKEGSKK